MLPVASDPDVSGELTSEKTAKRVKTMSTAGQSTIDLAVAQKEQARRLFKPDQIQPPLTQFETSSKPWQTQTTSRRTTRKPGFDEGLGPEGAIRD